MKIFLALLFLMSSSSLCVAQSGAAPPFVGTWSLQKFEVRNEVGEWVAFEQMGENPFGILMYDSVGNMAVQIARRDRGIPDPVDALDGIVNGYIAYAGTYEVDVDSTTVTHHSSVHINPEMGDQSAVRFYEFEGSTLTLSLAPDRQLRLTWIRLD